MNINKTFSAILIAILLLSNLFAQPNSTIKQPEISPELRKNAVDFLRQTIKEIPNLKAEENRQYFTIEMARMLWKYDEKESRAMFGRTMQEVKQSLAKMAEEYKKAVAEYKKKAKENPNIYGDNAPAVNYRTNVNRPSNKYYSNATNRAANIEPEISPYQVGMREKFGKVVNLRRNLIQSLTEAEPLLAYQFLTETDEMIPEGVGGYGYDEHHNPPEKRIVDALLKRNEIAKSLEIARNMLDKDFSSGFLGILFAIHEKDAVSGSALAEETLLELKIFADRSNREEISLFFGRAVESKNRPQPMLSEKSLRDLAKLLGQKVLTEMKREYYFDSFYYAKNIEKYAPREALQILQKSKTKRNSKADRYPANKPYYANTYPANYAVNVANLATNKPSNSAKPKNPKSKATPTPPIIEPLPDKFEQQMENNADFIQTLVNGKFTDEERKKVIAKAKEYAWANSPLNYPRIDGFIGVVAELARFSLFSADKQVADELMKEAETMVRPETKHAFDYAGKLFLAGGYSKYHPEKSFALMESLMSINDMIEHAVQLGTFFDFDSAYVPNNEVSAAFFIGEFGFFRESPGSGELQMFLQNLAKADLQRTKGIAEKFARPEFRMTAKMLILESLLSEFRKYERDYGRGGIDF